MLNRLSIRHGIPEDEIEDRWTLAQIELRYYFLCREKASEMRLQHITLRNAALEAIATAFGG